MQMNDILHQSGGLRSIAQELGIDESQASAGANALLPAILGGFKQHSEAQPQGLGGLVSMLGGLGGGGMLEQILAPHPTDPTAGNNVLGQIFGSKEVSRAVAGNASTQTGLDPGLLKKMLPLLAMLVGGYMAKHAGAAPATASGSGGLGGVLGSLLGGGNAPPAGNLGGLGSLLGGGGNNPLSDILGNLTGSGNPR